MNRQQLLSRLGRTWPIVYSNGVFTVWNRRDDYYLASPFGGRFDVKDNVHVDRPPRWLLGWPGRPIFDNLALRLTARRWRRKLQRLGAGADVVYLFHPEFARYLPYLRHDVLIYHAVDLFRNYPGFSAVSAEAEQQLLRAADLVLGSSPAIAEQLRKESNRAVSCLPNGVDFEIFNRTASSTSPVLAAIPRPRIGYSGALNRKFDFGLISDLATRRPAWQFILVGPVAHLDAEAEREFQRARSHSNVHFLGEQPHTAVPAYMQAFDVGLMCYRTEGLWTAAGYPLKLHEYLACGLPIVSADLEVVREFAKVAWIARTPDEWEILIARAIAGEGPATREDRVAIASANDWDRRVEMLRQLLEESLTRARLPA